MERAASSRRIAIVAQLLLVMPALPAVALMPREAAPVLLLPLTPAAGDGLAARAIAGGARLVGPGPLAGSLIVLGPGAPMLADGVLRLAAPLAGCGPAAGGA